MNIIEAVKSVFSNYANFKGRARRSEYWWFMLFFYIGYLGLLAVLPAAGIIFYLGVLIPLLAVGVRRMHDAGKSGWFLLVPIYNLVLACTDSEPGDNKWGPNPKTGGLSESELDELGTPGNSQ